MKKKLLIVYNSMNVGGSTTSLLSFLSLLDYNSFEVDLQMTFSGELENLIPSEINILPYHFDSARALRNKRKHSLRSKLTYLLALLFEKVRSANVRTQIMSLDAVRFYKPNLKKYDVAISFIENAPLYYVCKKIIARKKMAWIHTDYRDAKLLPIIDRRFLVNYDKIVSVSFENKKHFDAVFPELRTKSIVIENILSRNYVLKRSQQPPQIKLPFILRTIKLVTVCRIDFVSKGLDRAVAALAKLMKDGEINKNFIWYIIGDGPDFKKLAEIVKDAKLDNCIYLCGGFLNPLPLLKQCDIFFLPSRFEGKPMAVTEAQMLGLLPVVTEYASARTQIRDKINGLVLDNSDEAIYVFLKKCMESFNEIIELKKCVSHYEYSNTEEFKKVEELLGE